MASGGGDTTVQTIQPSNPTNIPLQGDLTGQSQRQLGYAAPYSYWPGYQLGPQAAMGQVFVGGPNPTIFGNPYNYGNAQGFFGGSALPNGGGSGGASYTQTQSQPVNQGYNPPGSLQHPLTQMLSQMLSPGMLSQMFQAYGRSLAQNPQGLGTALGGAMQQPPMPSPSPQGQQQQPQGQQQSQGQQQTNQQQTGGQQQTNLPPAGYTGG